MGSRFSGKVVLVTGASRGLGAATALAFADEGADVAITYVSSADKALALVAQMEAKGVRARAFHCDHGDSAAAAPLMDAVVAHFGKLDVLVNNAALGVAGKTLDDPEIDNAAVDRMWAVNVTGTVSNIRAAAKHLPDGGRIVNIGSSVSARLPFPGITDYGATKHAIHGYTRGAARDLGFRNITVNTVCAGIMPTEQSGMTPDTIPPALLEALCIRRMATCEEVAAAILWVASPEASYTTGSIIDVTGGSLA
ncbi:SDR family NAD(P)-dependent oxidoreductase [Novosphingobium colocasiae]|uniref:SDR family NAD(P)-dependent oxidoreductase n=1 Tax=Novosphingobium colocasiae TaxID=1256513 RepID=UPI0035B2B123